MRTMVVLACLLLTACDCDPGIGGRPPSYMFLVAIVGALLVFASEASNLRDP